MFINLNLKISNIEEIDLVIIKDRVQTRRQCLQARTICNCGDSDRYFDREAPLMRSFNSTLARLHVCAYRSLQHSLLSPQTSIIMTLNYHLYLSYLW